jgi:hypothetical protein
MVSPGTSRDDLFIMVCLRRKELDREFYYVKIGK